MITPVSECLYCQKNEMYQSLMIKICDLSSSEVFLFREQTYQGRCCVSYREHGVDFHQLSVRQRDAFMHDVMVVANALQKVFDPAKINYGSFSDKLSHLHIHIVPKYIDGPSYGGMFEMNPGKVFLTDDQYAELISNLKSHIKSEL